MSRSARPLPASIRLLTALGVAAILAMIGLGVACLVLTAMLDDQGSQRGPEYGAPAITRTCDAGDDLRSIWRTTFNGHRVDLYCGDRLLVSDDGRCWFEIAGAISPARCLEP